MMKYSSGKKIAFSPLLRDKLVWYLGFFATKAKRKLIIVMETEKTCFS